VRVGEQPVLEWRGFYRHEGGAVVRVGKLPSGREEKGWRKIEGIDVGM
jgi:hypothetical protein